MRQVNGKCLYPSHPFPPHPAVHISVWDVRLHALFRPGDGTLPKLGTVIALCVCVYNRDKYV